MASPQEAVSAVAHEEAEGRIQHFTNEPSGSSFPVFHYAKAPHLEATSAARPHVSTAAAGAVRKNQRDLPQRQLSAPSQRSPPEAPRSFRCCPSPTQVQPFSHDSARASPDSASKEGDNVITFGKNKYVVGGRHGVAPWQGKAAPHDPAQHNAVAAPVATMAEARKASQVVGNLNMLLRLQARSGIKGPALKALAGATGSASASCRPPSIPTSSQCANMNANLGGLGVGGIALGAKSLAAAGERGKMLVRQINLEVAPSTGMPGDTLGMMSGNGFPQRDPALARVVKRSTAPNRVCSATRAPSAPSAPGPSGAGGRR